MILTNSAPVYLKNNSFLPPNPGAKALSQSPTPATNFLAFFGQGDVPDTDGTVGRDHVMTMLNTGVRVQTRTGISIQTNSLNGFWIGTNTTGFQRAFDPRAIYDTFNDRWIATAGADDRSTNSSLLIGVSMTSNPTNGWNLRRVRADTNNLRWADYPTVGFNKDWIVVQANMISISNGVFERSHIWVFNKTNLYAGNFTSPTLLVHTNTAAALNEVPAITYDNSLSKLYLLQSANGNTNGSGYLRLFSITGAIGSETLNNVTNPIYVQVSNTWAHTLPPPAPWSCCFAPQSNSTLRIGTVADARLSSVVYRNGSLWAAHTIFLPTTNATRTAVQWWQIKPVTSELLQFGRIDDPLGINFYAFASMAVNRFEDVLIGYSSFSTNQYASASYSFRAFYDEMNKFRPPRTYWYGEAVSGNSRWGDYSATVVDPVNDTDLWTIQEYAAPLTGEGEIQWGTRWAQVTLAVPPNDHFTNAQTISGVQGNSNGTNIRATKETGEPNHAGNPDSVSVWYRWTAPTNGNVSFQTANNFYIALAAYTGTSVGNLTLVTNGLGAAGAGPAEIVFNAAAGTSYRIAVDGYTVSPNNQGDFQLSWSQPSVPIILTQPEGTNVIANANEDAIFKVWAIGNPAPTNRWRFKGTNATDVWANIANATNASYTISNVQTNHAGDYVVVAGNSFGAVTSSLATLFVHADSSARMSQWAMTNNQFRFHIYGLTNRAYRIETSTNLNSSTNWYKIYTNTVSYWYTNTVTTNDKQRFYRAITNG